jgi:phosphatidylserine decarboxylase
MRLPITSHGTREIVLAALACAAAGAGLWFLWPPLAACPALPFLAVLAFFRDPGRRPEVHPLPEGALLSPADGKVDFIGEVDEPLLGGRCLKISIFLSVLDVHMNRSPAAGRVERVERRPGDHLDARRPETMARNEANVLVLVSPAAGGSEVRLLVRQIVGAIARRIVCTAAPGRELSGGERFGMIKFGSRTDLCIPLERKVDLRIRLGQHVYAGRTLMGVLS